LGMFVHSYFSAVHVHRCYEGPNHNPTGRRFLLQHSLLMLVTSSVPGCNIETMTAKVSSSFQYLSVKVFRNWMELRDGW
jgi:hypothetical protein